MNLNTMFLPWWARPTTKHPSKGERKKQTSKERGPKKVEQEAQKPKLSHKLFSAISNNNLLIASSMLQPYYTQVGWFFIWVKKLCHFFPWIGLEDGAMQ